MVGRRHSFNRGVFNTWLTVNILLGQGIEVSVDTSPRQSKSIVDQLKLCN